MLLALYSIVGAVEDSDTVGGDEFDLGGAGLFRGGLAFASAWRDGYRPCRFQPRVLRPRRHRRQEASGSASAAAAGSSDDHTRDTTLQLAQPRVPFLDEFLFDSQDDAAHDFDFGGLLSDSAAEDLRASGRALKDVAKLTTRLRMRHREVKRLRRRVWALECELWTMREQQGEEAAEEAAGSSEREESEGELLARGDVVATKALFDRMTPSALARLSRAASEAAEKKLAEARLCCVCQDHDANAVIHGCGHKVCTDCIPQLLAEGSGYGSCPTCRGLLHEIGYTVLRD